MVGTTYSDQFAALIFPRETTQTLCKLWILLSHNLRVGGALMICFVKQKVANSFLHPAFQPPRLKRRGWEIKCLIYAVEGTPGLGEELKGEGPRARAQGAERCPWPSVLKAGARARGPELPWEKGHHLSPNSGWRRFKRETR